MKIALSSPRASQSGFSLFMTLVLVGIALTVLGATVSRTVTVSRLNDRNNTYVMGNAAAEAATEKVLAKMMLDFESGGLTSVTNNLSFYRSTVPTSAENSWWTNFVFLDGQGNANATYVAQTSTNASPAYTLLETQYPGLMAFSATYRVLSNVRPIFANNNYNFTNAVQQDVQMAEIPVYQFAIFFNGPLEFTGSATLTVKGRVHCNTNVCVGQPSGTTLSFSYFLTSSGIITNPPLAGLATSSYTGTIAYNGTPAPGWGTGEPVMTLPIGDTNNTASSVRQILAPPPAGESATNPISPQRFYNKADIVVMVTNNSVTVTLRSTPTDSSPLIFTNGTTAWTNANLSSWVGTNSGSNAFYDARQKLFVRTVQVDVGKLGTWLKSTNATKWSWASQDAFNGVLYVGNFNDVGNTNILDAVRLTNGLYIDSSTNAMPYGISVATINPLYIQGNFNATNYATNYNYLGSSNVFGLPPASVECDALTLLSPAWSDANASSSTYNCSSRTASAAGMTVNAAILAGNVPTTGSSATTYSGGVQNFCRLLEDWRTPSATLTLNTSIVCLFSSAQATNQFVQPTGTPSSDYYEPPTRNYFFNANYTTSAGLPPGTPFIDRMIRATWCSAPADNLTYAPSPTLDFVPQ